MKRKLILLTLLFSFSLSGFAYAEEEIVDNQIQVVEPAPIQEETSAPDLTQSTTGVINMMQGFNNQLANSIDSKVVLSTSNFMSGLWGKVAGFIVVFIPAWMIIHTLIEVFLIAIGGLVNIVMSAGGKQTASAGIGMSSAGSGNFMDKFLTEDYKAIMSSGSSGGGGFGAEASASNSTGTFAKMVSYAKLRAKACLIAVILIMLLTTPPIMNIILSLGRIVVDLFNNLANWVGGIRV